MLHARTIGPAAAVIQRNDGFRFAADSPGGQESRRRSCRGDEAEAMHRIDDGEVIDAGGTDVRSRSWNAQEPATSSTDTNG